MESSAREEVAIIGAGIAGTALALALDQRSVACRIYEARGADEAGGAIVSGVTVTPNGCRALDALGVLARIAPVSFAHETAVYTDAAGRTVDTVELASRARYGYAYHRVYRKTLLAALAAAVRERGIPVHYNAKFSRVISESAAEGVVFEVEEGGHSSGGGGGGGGGAVEQRRAALVVGADGIWSAVRKHIAPHCVPGYTGVAAVAARIPVVAGSRPGVPAGDNDDGEDHVLFKEYCTIQDAPGALFTIPEDAGASALLVGRQFAHADLGRAGWDALGADKAKLVGLLRGDDAEYARWHPLARDLVDRVCEDPAAVESAFLWPFVRVPPLDAWASPQGRVVVVGDAAHAMPPSSGQGASQALEDVYTLALLVRGLLLPPPAAAEAPASDELWGAALRFWHGWRQERVDAIVDAAKATDVKRLPEAERVRLGEDVGVQGLRDPAKREEWRKWIYQPDMEGDMNAWIEKHR